MNASRQHLEILAVLFTAAGKFVFMDVLNWKFIFIVGASLAWLGYLIYSWRVQPDVLRRWGFRWDNFSQVLRLVLPFGLLALTACLWVGYLKDTINLSWHLLPVLLLYPIWGTVQQYLLIALVAGNLSDSRLFRSNRKIVILVAALLFGGVHYPHPWLIAATFLLALFYGWVYLRDRNLYVLGLFHGWLGGLFYYTVLGRDPFMEIFGGVMGG